MKKTITILLLTALCMTVLTSCDVGHGLVAELMGGINRADEHLYPPEDCIEETEQALEQASTLPVGPCVSAFTIHSAREIRGGRTRRTHPFEDDAFGADSILRVGSNLEELAFDGWLCVTNADDPIFGYSINGEAPVFSLSFQTEPDAEVIEEAAAVNVEHFNAFSILIPMDDLPWGTYEITLWCANYQNKTKSDSNATEFFKIKVYKDSAYDEETACG